jgi:chorismate mutase-like protein
VSLVNESSQPMPQFQSQIPARPIETSLIVGNDRRNGRLPRYVRGPLIAVTVLLLIPGLALPSRSEAAPVSIDGVPERELPVGDANDGKAGMKSVCDLLVRRLDYIEEVSKSKWNRGSLVEDPEREQKILQDVASKAKELGLSPQYAQHFFRLQMEASKHVEYGLFAQWREENRGRFNKTFDLNSEIRPHLDSLDDAVIIALKTNWSTVASKQASQQVEACRVPSKFPAALGLALTPLTDRSAEISDHAPRSTPISP